MNKIYDEKTLLITGGSRGIGAAISEIFAKNGCNIAINYLEDNKQASLIYNKLKKEYNISIIIRKIVPYYEIIITHYIVWEKHFFERW